MKKCHGECVRQIIGKGCMMFNIQEVRISGKNLHLIIENVGTETICAKKLVLESEYFGKLDVGKLDVGDDLFLGISEKKSYTVTNISPIKDVQRNSIDIIRAFLHLNCDTWLYSNKFSAGFQPSGIVIYPRFLQMTYSSPIFHGAYLFNVGDEDVENVILEVRAGAVTTISPGPPPADSVILENDGKILRILLPLLRAGTSQGLLVNMVGDQTFEDSYICSVFLQDPALRNFAITKSYAMSWYPN